MGRTKLNCWEYQKCGREEGGKRTTELGVCPASLEGRLDTIHDGINAGRACWMVAGTLCGGKVQGTYATKISDCEKCYFYHMVKKEEPKLCLPVVLQFLMGSTARRLTAGILQSS